MKHIAKWHGKIKTYSKVTDVQALKHTVGYTA